jgi:hypothetical protein
MRKQVMLEEDTHDELVRYKVDCKLRTLGDAVADAMKKARGASK